MIQFKYIDHMKCSLKMQTKSLFPWQNFLQDKMGWQNLQLKAKKFVTEPFYILTVNLLTLLLPLSFLLLARISCAYYLLTVTSEEPPSSFLFSFFLYTNPAILYILVATIGIATLIHGLTGKLTILTESPGTTYRPQLYTAWIFLCTLQVSVGLGIEGSIAAGIDGASFGIERSLFSRVVFFLGLHETMLLWCRTVVKPVVDDTIFGASREERWADRVVLAMSFGSLWWWKLRDEVESLVVMPEAKREMLMDIGVGDFVGWWLYYLTVTSGMVRAIKGLLWIGMILLCRRARRNFDQSCEDDQDKV